jgi:glucokinase
MDRNMMAVFKGKPRLLLSELKEADAAVLGASALGWEAKFKEAAPAEKE